MSAYTTATAATMAAAAAGSATTVAGIVGEVKSFDAAMADVADAASRGHYVPLGDEPQRGFMSVNTESEHSSDSEYINVSPAVTPVAGGVGSKVEVGSWPARK